MKYLVIAGLVLTACGSSDPAPVDAAIDGAAASCVAAGACPLGPVCGAGCCGTGETCVSGVCRCGAGAACGGGDHCARPGPIGADACGTLCCGVSASCPR